MNLKFYFQNAIFCIFSNTRKKCLHIFNELNFIVCILCINILHFVPSGNEQTEHLQSNGGAATPAICVSRSQVTPIGSVRSAHMFTPANHMSERYPNYPDNPHMLKYRGKKF